MKDTLLEVSPYEADGGALIGRDPRTVQEEEWLQWTLPRGGMKAIRAKCMDCAHTGAEVRKCVATDCPLWAFRMGSNPKGLKEAREEQNPQI